MVDKLVKSKPPAVSRPKRLKYVLACRTNHSYNRPSADTIQMESHFG